MEKAERGVGGWNRIGKGHMKPGDKFVYLREPVMDTWDGPETVIFVAKQGWDEN